MRRALVLLAAAALVQTVALTADASQGLVKLSAKALDARTGRPVAGVVVLAFVPASQFQQVAQDTTDATGRFTLLLPKTTSLTDVRVKIIASPRDPCDTLRLVGIVGAVTSAAARGAVFPTSTPTEQGVARTFEPMGFIAMDDPCDWRLGSAGLYKNRDLE